MRPSYVCQNIPPSGIREIFNRIAENTDVISFALGEPDFTTPKPIIEAAYQTLSEGKTHYTPNAGIFALRSAISNHYKKEKYTPQQVVVTAGATEAILLSLLALVNRGDEVIVSEPYWPAYIGQILACGGVPRFVRTYEHDGFSLKPEHVEKIITPQTRILIINSPTNPTGAVTSREDLRALADLAIKHNLIVLTDEVYWRILYEGEFSSIADFEDMYDRCIRINSFSKTYAMTGWRIGYAIAPENIANEMTKMHENTSSCVSAFVQMAAMKALEVGEPFVNEMVNEFSIRRSLVVDAVRSIPKLNTICPKGAFYLYINIKDTGIKARDFAFSLLDKVNVALVPGSAFGQGQDEYLRMSFSSSQEKLLEGLNRISEFVNKI